MELDLQQAVPTVSGQEFKRFRQLCHGVIGNSLKMHEVTQLIERVADSDVPIFLFGESGTGKELIARAIHFQSRRSHQPFIPINCSAIPENLLEAELFGFVRGAFTGAEIAHEGMFALANGGTLFLDEVGDMPLSMQAKLLRVIEDHIFRPLGSKEEQHVDVRILTASNKDIKKLVVEKTFREDLFFRIHGLQLSLPALRDRKEDLPLLVDFFLKKKCDELGIPTKCFSPDAFEILARYSWPGNIRELESAIYNACLLSIGSVIETSVLQQKEELFIDCSACAYVAGCNDSLDGCLKQYEERLVCRSIQECRGNLSRAAHYLKIPRQRLYRLIKKYHIQMAALY